MSPKEMKTLTQRMRENTLDIHNESDRLVNLKLAFVLTSRELYGESIALFAQVYERLETILERHRDHPQLKPISEIILGDVARATRFVEDIMFYLGEEGYKALLRREVDDGKLPEVEKYLSHLSDLEQEDPVYIVPYIYHLYMAIFAGGYIIKRMVRRAMGLKVGDDRGVKLFSFPGEINTKNIREKFKSCINNEMNLSDVQEKRILEESNKVFVMNNQLIGTVQQTKLFSDITTMWTQRAMFLGLGLALSIYFYLS
mmetsp:Transcript_1984/g.2478  ORF Transcript_1984/g.2478 Transcript_1984/m.2478 type:complete len:257 (-) Transcript_1984:99-869(-)|eukprot:CAMPEP_0172508186 /NCGR_PEP_ID=MMETSP1066-20121228/210055_1 /TAXON_ID=671091 /ORGANISM="Coscinodiscus wailesii, Strain CCMP2513" /LENGTH=256 /DNA_ID=CAMNT_0013286059 /DNA_START=80 /DNA_END=850 /DNA_ORIENTATION=-